MDLRNRPRQVAKNLATSAAFACIDASAFSSLLPSPRGMHSHSDRPRRSRPGPSLPLHLCCRTCSHYSPGLFSGLREGRPPSVHQYCQNRGRCLPSGSSSNVNGLPYWGVVLNTPQEGPHDSAAIPAALPQDEKLDGHPRPPTTEEPSKPADPVQNLWQDQEGGG